MNRVYRLVFNRSLGLVQVASELGSSHRKTRARTSTRRAGKSAGAVPAKTPLAAALAMVLVLPILQATPAQAAPTVLPSFTGSAGAAGGVGDSSTVGSGAVGGSLGCYCYGGDGGSSSHTAGYPGGFGGRGYGAGGAGGKYTTVGVTGYNGGGGGAGGGYGTYFIGSGGSFAMYSGTTRRGGAGGAGGYSRGYSGQGGAGGMGALGYTFTLTNYGGTVVGGVGGSSPYWGSGGNGGVGVFGGQFFLYNGGTVAGGAGGNGSYLMPGYGGVGVISAGGSTIINAGTIAGGSAGSVYDSLGGVLYAGGAPQFSVYLANGGNSLKILPGSSLTGNVVSVSGSTGGGDTLSLAGSSNATLAGTFSSGTPSSTWSGSPVFFGFENLLMSGPNTWTITTTTGSAVNAIPNWNIAGGILQLATSNNFNPSSSDTLTIGVASTASASATPGVDNGELSTTGTANLNGEALTVNAGSGTFATGTQYDLVHADGGVTGSFGSVTYSSSFGSNITPKITYTTTDVLLTLNAKSGGGGAFGVLSLFGLLGLAGVGRKTGGRRVSTPG